MLAHPRRHFGRNLSWRFTLLPLLAVVAITAMELALGGKQMATSNLINPPSVIAPGASSAAPATGATLSVTAFRAPAGVAVRGITVYMSDVPTNAIWAHDLVTGAETLVTGSLGAGYAGDGGLASEAQLTGPRGIAFNTAGDLYIADSGNHAVRKIAADGTITTVAGNGTAGFSGDGGKAIGALLNTPTAVAVDSKGNLYIADTLNHRIRKVNRAGIIDTVAGSGVLSAVSHGTGGFGFSGDGGPAVGAQLSIPEGVAIDAQGNLYIADTGNDRIRKVDTNGVIRTIAGTGANSYSGDGGPAARANLYAPVGLAVGSGGSLYFSERYQQVVRMIAAGGKMVAIAGRGGIRGDAGDGGPAVRAKLNDPQAIAFDASGKLYVADTGNHRIRVVQPGGSIITIG
jgi:trimeric autotransporter adhesin